MEFVITKLLLFFTLLSSSAFAQNHYSLSQTLNDFLWNTNLRFCIKELKIEEPGRLDVTGKYIPGKVIIYDVFLPCKETR